MTVSTNYRASKVLQAFEAGDNDKTLAEINKVRREDIRAVVAQIPSISVPAFIKFMQRNKPILKSKFPRYHTWSLWILKCHHDFIKSLPREQREALTQSWQLTSDQRKQVLKCCNSIRKLRELNTFFKRQLELRQQQKQASRTAAAGAAGNKRRGLLFAANDASSDDEEFFGASTVGASESEDNWDELSEIKFGANDEDDAEEEMEQDVKAKTKLERSGKTEEAETIVVEDSDD